MGRACCKFRCAWSFRTISLLGRRFLMADRLEEDDSRVCGISSTDADSGAKGGASETGPLRRSRFSLALCWSGSRDQGLLVLLMKKRYGVLHTSRNGIPHGADSALSHSDAMCDKPFILLTISLRPRLVPKPLDSASSVELNRPAFITHGHRAPDPLFRDNIDL